MCGIAGLIAAAGLSPDWHVELTALARSLRHRGPDDDGMFTDQHTGDVPAHFDGSTPGVRSPRVAFAHRRLAIIDPTDAARQPMVRGGGKLFVSYNGEIYNFRELRSELARDGAVFRTQSDTEVLLAAYARWGIDAVSRLRGIFAFALADLTVGRVYLARDHLGVKPLYVARDRERWVFSSELKSFTALPTFRRELDFEAIREYLQFLWIGSERTGLAGVAKLAPGSWLEIDLATGESRARSYWTPLREELVASDDGVPGDVDRLSGELARAVSEQLVSDVPIGAFLSGGLDSSLIVALMKRAGTTPTTYSVGYAPRDLAYDIVPDDLPYARKAATRLGARNTEIVLTPDVAALLPDIVETLDEPIGDPAAISSYLVCKAAKQTQTVMLGGVGADELFGGYPRQRAMLYGSLYRRLPMPARRALASAAAWLPGAGRGRVAKMGRSAHKFVAAVERAPLHHYVAMETYFDDDRQHALLDASGPLARASGPAPMIAALSQRIVSLCPRDRLKQAILWDLATYLPSLNLAYTDRTSMAHGVEVRVPYLDVALVERALRLRARDLIRFRGARLEGKWLLKHAARSLLPAEIIWRKKAGFGAPVRSWLRADLADMRAELLGPRGLGSRGWFDRNALASLQKDFLSGRADYALHIWLLMSLELWVRRFIERPAMA